MRSVVRFERVQVFLNERPRRRGFQAGRGPFYGAIVTEKYDMRVVRHHATGKAPRANDAEMMAEGEGDAPGLPAVKADGRAVE